MSLFGVILFILKSRCGSSISLGLLKYQGQIGTDHNILPPSTASHVNAIRCLVFLSKKASQGRHKFGSFEVLKYVYLFLFLCILQRIDCFCWVICFCSCILFCPVKQFKSLFASMSAFSLFLI